MTFRAHRPSNGGALGPLRPAYPTEKKASGIVERLVWLGVMPV